MSTSITKTRITFKTDTKANWEIQENNFQTLKGELYFYSDYYDTGKLNSKGDKIYIPQLKIGNGSSKLKDLAFFKNNYINTTQIDALFSSSVAGTNILGQGTLGTFRLGIIETSNLLDSATLDSLVLD